MTSKQFNYYFGNQAEQFSFYRVPKRLFTDSKFRNLSSDAKVLYGLMLDRMSLSLKNDWKDDQDRIYIYFTLVEVQEMMNCGHNKGVKIMAELDAENGIGLIQRVKQGMGKPTKIYVMNFLGMENVNPESLIASGDFPTKEIKTSEKGKSRVPGIGSQDFPKKESINTDISKTDFNETDKEKINLSINHRARVNSVKRQKEMDRWMEYRDIFKKNIDYEALMLDDPEQVSELLELMIETTCSEAKSFRINGSSVPAERVKERLLSLNMLHLQYVLETLQKNTTDVKNIKAYMLATLYNAKNTIASYYQSRVSHDLYGRKREGWL